MSRGDGAGVMKIFAEVILEATLKKLGKSLRDLLGQDYRVAIFVGNATNFKDACCVNEMPPEMIGEIVADTNRIAIHGPAEGSNEETHGSTTPLPLCPERRDPEEPGEVKDPFRGERRGTKGFHEGADQPEFPTPYGNGFLDPYREVHSDRRPYSFGPVL